MNSLTILGFSEVYNYPYSHATFLSEILAIRAQCDSSTIMCVGGGISDNRLLKVVACANCLDITKQTKQNQPKLHGLAYWYMAPKLSFGFSPSQTITQNQADTTIIGSELRLSWHLDIGNVGGWRLGNITSLNGDNLFYKKIFLKKS